MVSVGVWMKEGGAGGDWGVWEEEEGGGEEEEEKEDEEEADDL